MKTSKADLHLHTRFSCDSFASVRRVVHEAIRKGIKVIAITDHDEIKGALKAKKYVEKHNLPLEVIIGEEVSSRAGHIIGLFLKKKVKPHMSYRRTIEAIKAQGGMVVIPHLAFTEKVKGDHWYRYRIHFTRVLQEPDLIPKIDAIEGANFTVFDNDFCEDMQDHIHLFNKPLTGGSDAHIPQHVGLAYVEFPGETIEDLKKALEERTTVPVRVRSYNMFDIVHHSIGIVKIPFFFIRKFILSTTENLLKVAFYPIYRTYKKRAELKEVHSQ